MVLVENKEEKNNGTIYFISMTEDTSISKNCKHYSHIYKAAKSLTNSFTAFSKCKIHIHT